MTFPNNSAFLRFIPTHAGNTHAPGIALRYSPVHPHTRGEHVNENDATGRQAGSSPHTRGTRRYVPPPLRKNRFIPTHAGNTHMTIYAQSEKTVHPHTRGEHSNGRTCVRNTRGSSPHTRGTPQRLAAAPMIDRFIPTHAGNTFDQYPSNSPLSVHPHTRGEHMRSVGVRAPRCGSSPHTRGTPEYLTVFPLLARFIPTHAGNTLVAVTTISVSPVHPHTRGEH